ncbi:GerAB/ArcD/ProY family transporter [Clostridium tarantellae]|uniref:GerAB/ArcD/ProY family transporter n=1 Tax=Clostridium tarantellae TaxID=39493 RepID=A0A6I1MN94_9CLOT|nr:GerAB/ArcD/ProY family transporter [Clostridium tarantellae]MPQ43722.1 GerAB/ArcD/ProY family transporter [Clostridium tarantellae]
MEKLTSRHFIFFIIGSMTISLISYPSLFIQWGKNDTWICTFFAAIIFLLFSFFTIGVMNNTKEYDFKSICFKTLGKFFGTIYLLIFSATIILTCIESTSINATSIHTNIFLDTPIWYSLLLFLITAYLISKNNFNSIIMVTSVSIIVVIFFTILINSFSIKYVDLGLILPLLKNESINNLIICTLKQLGSLSAFSLLLPIIYRVDDKKNFMKNTLASVFLILIILIGINFILIGTLGAFRCENIFFPQFIQSERIYFGGFVENGEIFVIIISMLAWIIKYLIATFSLYSLWKDKIKNKNIYFLFLALIVYAASYFLCRNTYFLFYILNYFQYVLLIVFFILPIIIYLLFNIKKAKK